MTERSATQNIKIATMQGVREYSEGYQVELWLYDGRLVIRAYNEASYNETNVDVGDLLEWLRLGPDGQQILGTQDDSDADKRNSTGAGVDLRAN